MTQELNKDGLEAAIDALLLSGAWKSKISLRMVARKMIIAYLSHPKVTGFESRIVALNSEAYGAKLHEWIADAHTLINDMQSALAGGNTK